MSLVHSLKSDISSFTLFSPIPFSHSLNCMIVALTIHVHSCNHNWVTSTFSFSHPNVLLFNFSIDILLSELSCQLLLSSVFHLSCRLLFSFLFCVLLFVVYFLLSAVFSSLCCCSYCVVFLLSTLSYLFLHCDFLAFIDLYVPLCLFFRLCSCFYHSFSMQIVSYCLYVAKSCGE